MKNCLGETPSPTDTPTIERELESEGNLSRHMGKFLSGTLLSRVSGLVRDLSMAFAFGDHPSVAAFLVAFRFSNLFRRLVGDGPLQNSFVPYFEKLRHLNGESIALFFFAVSWLLSSSLYLESYF